MRLTELPAWQALAAHRARSDFLLRDLFASDTQRAAAFSVRCGDVLLDYSKGLLNRETLRLLIALARERELGEAITRLFRGDIVNPSEQRPALHTALRATSPVLSDGQDVTVAVRREIERMRAFVASIRDKQSGVTDIIHIGIGGSYLGPAWAGDALQGYAEKTLRVHYLSTTDGAALQQLFGQLNPRTTRVVVASKSFSTAETQANARAVLDWLAGAVGGTSAALAQFAAVTAQPERAVAFGVATERIFHVWDWVGGRYSLCSTMALPFALQAGMEPFDAMLAGARAADEHFQSTPFDANIPVILALLDIWHANFHGAASRVVLPYVPGYAHFPAWLQQLEMESLGKRVTLSGAPVDYDTGLVTWGNFGTNGQHAFHQLLHQGTRLIPADFIIACRTRHAFAEHHRLLLANALSQAQALMTGSSGNGEPHRVLPGNRPSNMLVLPEADAFHLGLLAALYEHKVYVASVIWDINAFDQWGVELGKQLAGGIHAALAPRGAPGAASGNTISADTTDASTAALIQHIQAQTGRTP